MGRVLSAPLAVSAQLQALGHVLLVLARMVVASLAFGARQGDLLLRHRSNAEFGMLNSEWNPFRIPNSALRIPQVHLIISVITPAPTVLPPSRIAKRCSFSIATGWMSSTVMVIVSPGMTISVPAGSVTSPVTSVVRK